MKLNSYILSHKGFYAELIKHSIFVCLCLVKVIPCYAAGPLYKCADSLTICQLLHEAKKQPESASQPLFFARKFIGYPYIAHTLETEEGERLVVNTRQFDCTTLVETVTALTACTRNSQYTWEAFLKTLQTMRYRRGKITDYTSRIHYFTDWIVENQRRGLVTEIQAPNPPLSAVQKVFVGYMSQHPAAYQALRKHPEYVGTISQMEKQINGLKFRYIPKSRVGRSAELKKIIKDGDIIAITSSKPGLDIAHLGFAVWGSDGNLHMLNASQLHKKVVEEPMTLYQYLQKHPSHTGIRIVRIAK